VVLLLLWSWRLFLLLIRLLLLVKLVCLPAAVLMLP
jgi:hypothetical protein